MWVSIKKTHFNLISWEIKKWLYKHRWTRHHMTKIKHFWGSDSNLKLHVKQKRLDKGEPEILLWHKKSLDFYINAFFQRWNKKIIGEPTFTPFCSFESERLIFKCLKMHLISSLIHMLAPLIITPNILLIKMIWHLRRI